MKNPYRQSQKGSLLLEVVMAISIIMIVTASAVFYQAQEFQKDTAKAYGLQIAQYTSAVRAALVADGANVMTGGSPLVNINRLKINNGSCPGGTATQPFLACTFSSTLFYGVDISTLGTTLASNGAAPNPTYSGVTVFPGVTDSNGMARPDLSGLASQAAARYDSYDKASSFSGGTIAYQFFLNAGTYTNPATGAPVAVAANSIVAIAIADSGADIFLRRNGTNNMQGTLDMNSNNIAAAGSYTGLGSMSVNGTYTGGGNMSVSGTYTGGGNMAVAGNIMGNTVQVVAVNVAGTPCSTNGVMSEDAVGLILSCQSGLWEAASGDANQMIDLGHAAVGAGSIYWLPNTKGKSLLVHAVAVGVSNCPHAIGIIQYNASGTQMTRMIDLNTFGSGNDRGSGYTSEIETNIPLMKDTAYVQVVTGSNESAFGLCGGSAWADMDYFVY